MGIVYYSRYFEYFEEARTEMLRSIGLKIRSMENSGLFLPVIKAYCDYKKGLKLEQEVIVKVSILDLPKSKLKVTYEIQDKNKKNVSGYTEHSFLKKNGRPTGAPSFIINAIKKHI
jgi:acyl-CoA thioester hydrolase